MNRRQELLRRRLDNVVVHLEDVAASAPGKDQPPRKRSIALSPELTRVLERLRAARQEIAALHVEQSTVELSAAARFRAHAEKLRAAHLRPLAEHTRRLFRNDARMLLALEIPHKRAPAEVIPAGERMLAALGPHRRFLSQEGVDVRRISRLREELAQLKRLAKQLPARPRSQSATQRLKEVFAAVAVDLRILDVSLRPTLTGADLHAWNHATRPRKPLGRPKKKRGRPRRGVLAEDVAVIVAAPSAS